MRPIHPMIMRLARRNARIVRPNLMIDGRDTGLMGTLGRVCLLDN